MDKTFDVEQIEQYELTPAEVIAGSQQHQTRTPVEKRLLRKADFVIIPLFSMVHLVSYLVCSSYDSPSWRAKTLRGPKGPQ